MADVDGTRLNVGDRVEIVTMDDPGYRFLVGQQGLVDALPPDEDPVRELQVILTLDGPTAALVPAISTQQAWVRKVSE